MIYGHHVMLALTQNRELLDMQQQQMLQETCSNNAACLVHAPGACCREDLLGQLPQQRLHAQRLGSSLARHTNTDRGPVLGRGAPAIPADRRVALMRPTLSVYEASCWLHMASSNELCAALSQMGIFWKLWC